MGRPRLRDQRGFTLIELMIVVAIVAILAAVVVPMFTGEARKVSASSEVSAMFAELSTKQEQYKVEMGAYLAVPACPTTPSNKDQDISACVASASWIALRVIPPESKLKCSYQVNVGTSADDPNVAIPAGFVLPAAPATGWYWVHAKCNMDGNAAVFSEYLQSNLNSEIQKLNEGK